MKPPVRTHKRIPKTPSTPLAFIFYVLRHCSRRMKWLGGIAVSVHLVGIMMDTTFFSWVLGHAVGKIVETRGQLGDDLWPMLGFMTLFWIVRTMCFRVREYLDRIYIPELLNVTRELLFNRLIQQSQSFLQSNFAGVLANHVRRGADVVRGLRDKMVQSILPLIVRFLTAGALLWTVTPKFALFIMGFVVVAIFAAVKTAPKATLLSMNDADASSRLTGYIVDSVTNLSVVQQNSGWREELSRLDTAHAELNETFRARSRFISNFWGSFDAVAIFFFSGFIMLLASAARAGEIAVGDLVMCLGLVGSLFGALAGTMDVLSSKFDDIGILKDALHKISSPLSLMDEKDAPDLDVPQGAIEFRHVDFSYNAGRPVFENLNISIPAGQRVGFVGVSGAGKTTLCQLLLRAYDVTGGGIYVDGQNIAKVTQDSLHDAIAVIPQEPILFHRSLADNIRYGRRSADDDDVRNAAVAAAAASFIETLPHGFHTLVGERGVKLSGGQRQRIAIARAIVKNAPILVLDEATSALDSETEKAIQSAMLQAMKGRTTLVIAHRLSTLSHMDRIIVMDHGRVVEDGTFAELMAANGTFAKLWNLQAGGFLPEEI